MTPARELLPLALVCLIVVLAPTVSAARAVRRTADHAGINASTRAELWPLPLSVTYGTTTLQLPTDASAFSFKQTGGAGTSSTLTAAFARYTAILYPSETDTAAAGVGAGATVEGTLARQAARAGASSLTGVDVFVASPNTPLDFGVNETYSLLVQSPRASIYADTVWGAMHGLETFSQLVQVGVDASNDAVLQVWDAPVTISDGPRFPHRGLLIDTSRHYLPVDLILHIVDALSYNKMNVLHMHLVDAESFPVETTQYSELAAAGAYAPFLTYSATNLSAIVAYATARGVRVLPEFDVPGHAYSWGMGYPNLTATCPGYAANINNIPLNPCNDFTFDVLRGVIGQMSGIFTDSFFHVGGDEVVYGCWAEDPSIQQCVKDKGFANYNDLMQYFVTTNDGIVTSNKKTVVHWNDVFDEGIKVDPSTVYQVWTSHAVLQQVVQAGYRAILSNSNAWYLNCGFNPGCAYITWQEMYDNEIFANVTVTPEQAKLVIGGEAAMWSTWTDRTNWDPQVWPRNSAVAERLWSPASVDDTATAQPRLAYHRCRMVSRGIMASPITTGYCPRVFP